MELTRDWLWTYVTGRMRRHTEDAGKFVTFLLEIRREVYPYYNAVEFTLLEEELDANPELYKIILNGLVARMDRQFREGG